MEPSSPQPLARALLDRRTLRETLDPLAVLRWFWSRRDLVDQLTRREVHMRFRESFLGWVWGLVHPLLTLAVYAFVFTVIFQPRVTIEGASRFDFVLRLFAGLLVYNAFSEPVGRAPLLVVSKPSYVKQVVFPLEVLPLSVLGAALFSLGLGVLVLLVAAAIGKQTVSYTLWLFPVTLLPLCLVTLGASWFLAALGVFVRDVQQATRVLLQLLFFATPVVWAPQNLPEGLRPWLALNPLAGVVETARATLLYGTWPPWGAFAGSTAFGAALAALGLLWFRATRRGFADVI